MHLLSELLSTFHSVVTLSLIWNDTAISEPSFRAIDSITTLRKLWISAGGTAGKLITRLFSENSSILSTSHASRIRKIHTCCTCLPLRDGDPIYCLDEYYHTFVLPGYGPYEPYLQPGEINRMETGTEIGTGGLGEMMASKDCGDHEQICEQPT